METIRAFIALVMPESVAEAAGTVRRALEEQGVRLRWVKPENIHLTLRFLGDVDLSVVSQIWKVLGQVVYETPPFSLKVSGAGVFPGISRPSAVWMGLSGDTAALERLYQTLSEGLAEIGTPRETRSFAGHLTVGRVRGRIDSGHLKTALAALETLSTPDFRVEELTLFQSELTSKGPIYTPLETARFI